MTDHHSHTAITPPPRPRGQARQPAAPTYSPSAGGDTAPRTFPFLAGVGLAVAFLLLATAPLAQAGTTHVQLSTITSESPAKLAIDQSKSVVYSMNANAGGITKYDIATGEPVAFSALGSPVINGKGEGDPLGSADKTPQNGIVGQGDDDIAVDNSGGPAQGNIYVADVVNEGGLVEAFNSAGEYLYELNGTETSTPHFGNPCGVGVDGSGDLYVAGFGAATAFKYTTTATSATPDAAQPEIHLGTHPCHIAVDPAGDVFAPTETRSIIRLNASEHYEHPTQVDPGPVYDAAIDPSSGDLYLPAGGEVREYDSLNSLRSKFSSPGLIEAVGAAIQASTHDVLIADQAAGLIRVFGPSLVVPDVSAEPVTERTPTTVTLNGTVHPDGVQLTDCYFEYGTTSDYDHTMPCEPAAALIPADFEPHAVTAKISGLIAATAYRFRLVATNGNDQGGRLEVSNEETFITSQPPTIESFSSSHLTATSADLDARIDPQGFDTTYHFEYGPTTAYGTSRPLSEEEAKITTELFASHSIEVHIANLQPDTTYHFRLVAENKWGKRTSEDQSFEFEPPNCPNSHVRQQTFSEYLPDCRAYELVSPEDANGAILEPNIPGPNSPSPLADERFAFAALFSTIPGTGEPVNGYGSDTYVATRTPEGWVTKYVGLPGNQTPYDHTRFADLSMGKFLTFDEGEGLSVGVNPHVGSSAPYIYGADGQFLERWPTNLASVPGGEGPNAEGHHTVGAALPSPDFSHYFFSSSTVEFAPGGLTAAPGSVYDNNVAARTVSIASIGPHGTNIPPGVGGSQETIQLPAVSTDGSHILMSTEAADGGVQLYLRVDEAATYEVSEGHGVQLVGMTSDGSEVYFTSEERLLPADTDDSTDVYMWSAEKAERDEQPLTLVSIGAEGAGNSDACNVSWAQRCGAVPISTGNADFQDTHDSAIASENGDLYFYSPEQLDGDRGVFDGQNLYDYREGGPHFVATLEPSGTYCDSIVTQICTSGPLVRIDVAPDDSHAAFLTTTPLTAYDNTASNGICSLNEGGEPATGPRCEEMYLYTPASGKLICASCDPSGVPPVGDAYASDNGLFMANDGRAFFYTPDALVPADTNELNDVYEYVDGRPHLITTGLGGRDVLTRCDSGECSSGRAPRSAGLSGVSADGTNVYFSSYEPLVPQDHNGNFLRFYDARTNGGFTFNPPAAPCTAADECHGPGTSPPTTPHLASNGPSSSRGNASSGPRKHHKKKHHKRKVKLHHHRGGGK